MIASSSASDTNCQFVAIDQPVATMIVGCYNGVYQFIIVDIHVVDTLADKFVC